MRSRFGQVLPVPLDLQFAELRHSSMMKEDVKHDKFHHAARQIRINVSNHRNHREVWIAEDPINARAYGYDEF